MMNVIVGLMLIANFAKCMMNMPIKADQKEITELVFQTIQYCLLLHLNHKMVVSELCLTQFSAIFQQYHGLIGLLLIYIQSKCTLGTQSPLKVIEAPTLTHIPQKPIISILAYKPINHLNSNVKGVCIIMNNLRVMVIGIYFTAQTTFGKGSCIRFY